MTQSGHLFQPGKQLGNYVIRSMVGSGGWGTVYMAEHPTIGRRVAVKVLREHLAQSPEALERFAPP
jgi:serine/threonine-protein kinase